MLDFDAYLCVGGGGGVERFIEGSNEAIFKTLDDAWFWCSILTLDWHLGGGGVQNALFKIAAKQYLRLLMMLDFDACFWCLILMLDFFDLALQTDRRTMLTLESLRDWKGNLIEESLNLSMWISFKADVRTALA